MIIFSVGQAHKLSIKLVFVNSYPVHQVIYPFLVVLLR
uniref:Uncharacterized protein n=1 Tax=Setaria italica TaxID=4555 RepID=K3ZFQ2_SETIT